MRRRVLIGGLFALLAAAISLPTAIPAHASAPVAVSPAISANSEIVRMTSTETSIDAPAVWTTTSGTVRSVLAWVGVDSAHRLNVMISNDGLHYSNKITLDETSIARPAVVRSDAGAVIIAWTGTDSNHSLNVLYNVYGATRKLTLTNDNSFTAPALALTGNQLLLSWSGTDGNNTLNVLPLSLPNLTPGAKTTLPAAYNSGAAPNISFDPLRTAYLLAWTARDPANVVSYATSANGVSWSAPVRLPETSYASPGMIGIPSAYAATVPGHYLAWTGTDGPRSVNVRFTDNFADWVAGGLKATLGETAFGASQVGFIGGYRQVLVAWTGTDEAHHLNVAVVAPNDPCALSVTGVSANLITKGTNTDKVVAITIDAGGEDGARATQILDALSAAPSGKVRATWFLEGQWVQDHPDLARRVRTDGHEIGNHTVDHPDLVNPSKTFNYYVLRPDYYVCYELTLNDQIVSDVTGQQNATRQTNPPFFRPPYGAYNTQVRTLAASLGYRSIYWTIDPVDWDPATTKAMILSRVLNNLQPGAIILLHAGGANTPAALPELIQGIRDRGYTIVPLSQLKLPS